MQNHANILIDITCVLHYVGVPHAILVVLVSTNSFLLSPSWSMNTSHQASDPEMTAVPNGRDFQPDLVE